MNNFIIENAALLAISGCLLLFFLVLTIIIFRKTGNMREFLLQSQGDLTGRLAALGELNLQNQNQLYAALGEQRNAVLKIIDEKLLLLNKNVDEGLMQNSIKTNETLAALRERLTKIDVAQQKISSLSEQVVSLQEVLSNKQARGAFGEIQLNDLVTSILPPSVYTFQALLSNGKKADCLLRLPNPPGAIAIDAKFPLESYYALRKAVTPAEKNEAERFFRASVIKHIRDISEKYILPDETAESALMFLPSEAIYAELHANFIDVVENSYKAKVWIVSPTTLMATLNTIRAILKDANMREQAGVIQKEVSLLIDDIGRLDERVANLDRHFHQACDDIEQIKISSGKVARKIQKIEAVELESSDIDASIRQLAGNDK